VSLDIRYFFNATEHILFIAGSAIFGMGQMWLIVGIIRSEAISGLSRKLLPLAGVAFIVLLMNTNTDI